MSAARQRRPETMNSGALMGGRAMPTPGFIVELGRDPAHRVKQLAGFGIDVLHTYPNRVIARSSPARFQRLLDEGIPAYRLGDPVWRSPM